MRNIYSGERVSYVSPFRALFQVALYLTTKSGIKMNSNSLKIKLSHFEIMCSGKAFGTLLGLIRDLTGTSTSPKKETPSRRSLLPLSLFLYLSLFLSFSTASTASRFLYQDARETFRGNAGVTAAGSAGCIFFYDIIYDINFAPVTSAPPGVVKRAETLSSFPAISLSRAGNDDNDDNARYDGEGWRGLERKGCREAT